MEYVHEFKNILWRTNKRSTRLQSTRGQNMNKPGAGNVSTGSIVKGRPDIQFWDGLI